MLPKSSASGETAQPCVQFRCEEAGFEDSGMIIRTEIQARGWEYHNVGFDFGNSLWLLSLQRESNDENNGDLFRLVQFPEIITLH